MRRRPAFTLFELLLVLSLLILMASLGLPAIGSWIERTQIDRATGVVVQFASEAKRRAIEDGEAWSIRYSASGSKLHLARSSSGASGVSKANARIAGRTTSQFSDQDEKTLGRDIVVQFSHIGTQIKLGELQVSPLGAITPASISIFHSDRLVQSLVTERLTGDIRRVR